MIYLDNAATTYPKTEAVYLAMDKANRTLAVNAGRGSYKLAKKASEMIENTRNKILSLAKAQDKAEVVFSPSATIACNQVLRGLEWDSEKVVYLSPYEHNAVVRVVDDLKEKYGFSVEELAISEETLELDLEKIKYQFARKNPSVIISSHVSNVIGCIVDIEQLSQIGCEYNATIIIDGSQALGVIPVDLKKSPADFYIFAGHKTLYGPLGIGGFINNRGRFLSPVLAGGTGSDSLNPKMDTSSNAGYEPGSHNIVAIAGLLAALEEIENDFETRAAKENELSVFLIENLKKIPEITVYDIKNKAQQSGIVAFNMEGLKASDVGYILDEDYDIAVRTGYQCAPLIHKHIKSTEYGGVVRVGLGQFNTKEEIIKLCEALEEIVEG